MQVKYINKSMYGIDKDNEYIVLFKEPSKGIYTYTAHFIYNVTKQEEMDLFMPYASMKSIERNFKYKKWEIEE